MMIMATKTHQVITGRHTLAVSFLVSCSMVKAMRAHSDSLFPPKHSSAKLSGCCVLSPPWNLGDRLPLSNVRSHPRAALAQRLVGPLASTKDSCKGLLSTRAPCRMSRAYVTAAVQLNFSSPLTHLLTPLQHCFQEMSPQSSYLSHRDDLLGEGNLRHCCNSSRN